MSAITFLMDSDPPNASNAFFANAKGYFKQLNSEVIDAPAGGQTLDGVFTELRNRSRLSPAKIHDPINIVSHATGFSSLQFRLRAGATSPTTADDLTAEILKIRAKALDAWQPLGRPIVAPTTSVVLYGCDVGRSESFLRDFGSLFSDALGVYAPLRVATFRHSGATFEHRLARTWSVPWPSDVARSTDWPATRTAFVSAGVLKFGTRWMAVRNDPLGTLGLEDELKTIAASATAQQAAAWFFGEQVTLAGVDPQDPQAAIARMIPLHSAVISPGGSDVDDTTVENVVGPAHLTEKVNATTWRANIAVLAQIIEKAVVITSTDQYRHVDIRPEQAPSPGPKPPPNVPPIVPAPHSSLWDEVRDELIAGGVGANEVDGLAGELAPVEPERLALVDPELPSPGGTDRALAEGDFA